MPKGVRAPPKSESAILDVVKSKPGHLNLGETSVIDDRIFTFIKCCTSAAYYRTARSSILGYQVYNQINITIYSV
jgi:hypothetical protein